MPFGQMRTEFVEGAGAMVEGKLVEGTVVEGTVVEGTTVVDGNTVLDGEMLGAEPAMLLPELALSPRPGAGPTVLPGAGPTVLPGAGPTVLPSWLGGVPVMLRVCRRRGRTHGGGGRCARRRGDAAGGQWPLHPAQRRRLARRPGKARGMRRGPRRAEAADGMEAAWEVSFATGLSRDNHARFVPTKPRKVGAKPLKTHGTVRRLLPCVR